jgi:hypothetical protein
VLLVMSETKHVTDTEALPHDGLAVDQRDDEPVGEVELDAVAAAAVDLAREAAEADAPGLVGAHLGVEPDEPRVVVHYFATLDPAYVGWRWAVTVARASRSKSTTVDDVVLLPGGDALLAPEWLPWSDRLRPGDVGAGDLLPTAADDRRLTPAYFSTEDDEEAATSFELGLGRERVMSFEGRLETVDRWYAGDPGPRAEVARSAPASCATCGFYLPLAGGLHQAFGACANEFAPDDGKVVAVDHGCGAHSEAVVVPVSPPPPPPLVDEAGYDILDAATLAEIVETDAVAVVDDAAATEDAVAEPPVEVVAVDEAADDPVAADDSVIGMELEVAAGIDDIDADSVDSGGAGEGLGTA